MAIAFDATSEAFDNALARPASLQWNHTCTGSDRILFVAVEASITPSITGVTYNGVSMTLVDSNTTQPISVFDEYFLYVLANPASGTNQVSVQTTGTGNINCYGKAASYTGANSTGQPPHKNKGVATSGTTISVAVDTSTSPSTDNCWLVGAGFTDGNYTSSAGAGTTQRAKGAVGDWVCFYDTNAPITPPGSDTVDVTVSNAASVRVLIVASVAPSGGTPTNTTNFFHLMT